MLNQNQETEVIDTPMDDSAIHNYLPGAKIITYSDLAKYDSIDELLPNNKDFAFLLYESSPNKGHWIVVSKYNNQIEFFDPYGGKPDSALHWNSAQTNAKLGQNQKLLSNLLDNYEGKVVFNPVKYQGSGSDVNTCGRHCTFRTKQMQHGQNLSQYYKYMRALKENSNKDYDELVANFIRN